MCKRSPGPLDFRYGWIQVIKLLGQVSLCLFFLSFMMATKLVREFSFSVISSQSAVTVSHWCVLGVGNELIIVAVGMGSADSMPGSEISLS